VKEEIASDEARKVKWGICKGGVMATNPNLQRDKPIRRDSEPWHAARLEGAKPR